MADNREIVKGARALSRDPNATAHNLRGALKGMLSLYDEINATTFSAGVTDDMVKRALQGFDCGTGDPNDYKRRMRLALEAALQPLT